MHDSWTKAINLQQWAKKTTARSLLPAVIRRLIWATAKPTHEFSFPAGEEVQRPSWDGRLMVDQGNVWVPDKASFWEISVGNPPASKAAENYQKRTSGTPVEEAAERTFVFVTPLKWTDKLEWAEARKKENKWKDVRVLDSDDLEHWIEIAPVVDIWLAQIIGKRPVGVRDLSSHWEAIAALTEPPMPPDAFLAGRERTRNDLSKALSGIPGEILVSASSEQELVDFVAAAFGSLEDNDSLPARCVIVEAKGAWESLTKCSEPLVLIAAPGLAVAKISVASAVKAGHHVITRRPYSSLPQTGVIKLSRAWRFEIGTALTKAGFSEERAQRLSRECGGYLTALQRLAVPGSGSEEPEWARDGEGALLLPFILIGAWDDAQVADRDIVAKLAGNEYDRAVEFAAGCLTKPESPFRRSGREWHLASREDAWIHLAPRLTRDQLERFTTLAISVLSEDDPRFEMKPDERVFASIHDKMPRHSSALREGLAETLALLGAGLIPLPALPASDGASYAVKAVRELLSQANTTHRWFTLSPILTLLAEAAPDEFMDAVERDLASAQPALAGLLAEDDSGIFGGNHHHFMMWALTSLAWHPAYLTRSVLALAKLAELDPGGRMNPRPAGSLHDIFRPWMPQTAANPSQRFEVIDRLTETNPSTAWDLLMAILPKGNDSAMGTTAPRWREWPARKWPHVTRREVREQWEWTGQRLVTLAKHYPKRLRSLVSEVDHLLDNEFTSLLSHLSSDEPIKLSREHRQSIWNALHKLIRDHEYFHAADWRMADKRLSKLREVEEHLRPDAPADYGRWLFEHDHLHFGTRPETSYEDQRAMALEQRKKLILELHAQGGIQAVADFAETLPYPGLVGDVLAKAMPALPPMEVLPHYLEVENPNTSIFGKGFASAAFHQRGWDWVDSLPLMKWSTTSATAFLLILPDTPRTWTLAQSLGREVEDAYWNQVFPYPRDLCMEDAAHAVKCLLEHNRPLVAAQYAGYVYHNKMRLPAQILADILERAVSALNEASATQNDLSHVIYELEELLRHLQDAPDNDPAQVAQLEWTYLPLMRHGSASPKFLQKELGRNPVFFVHCVELIYRNQGEQSEAASAPETDLSKARLAHELLDSWRTHPALHENGGPNEAALKDWIESARQGCSASQRGDSGDYQIGKLLASSPSEPDGSWPCIAVRNVLESIPGDSALRAFETAIFNQRGCTTRSLHEGGEQERDLAKKYHRHADECQMRWPRVSAALRSLARGYEADAHRMDERADDEG
jgi:hypothetical protein